MAETLSSQKDDEYLPSHSTYNHLYLGITPTFRYTKNMRSLTITAKPLIPSVEQTRNRISDANPLVLTGGNPDLHQAYTILLTYMDNLLMDKKSLFNIGLTLNAFCTLNPIVNRAYYFNEDTSLDSYNGYLARGGSILNTFSNASSPAYSMEGGLSFSKRFQKANLKSNLKISGGLESRPQYLFDELAHISMKKVSASVAYRRGEEGLLAGLRHSDPTHRYLREIPAWQRSHLSALRHGDPTYRYFRVILAWQRSHLSGLRHGHPTHRYFRDIPAWQRGLLAGLRHGDPAHRYLSDIPAWRRGLLDGLRHGDLACRCLSGIPAWRRSHLSGLRHGDPTYR